MTIEIREQTADDAHEVRRLVTAAFGDDGRVATLVEALRARGDQQVSLVAVDSGDIVGHTHVSTSWVDAPDRIVDVSVLSPLAVLPSHQGQGVGTQLQRAAIAAADRLGSPLIFLEGDPAYYSRTGWRSGVEFGFTAPSVRIPAPGFQVVTLGAYDPSITGALVYNDTFWIHDCVGLRR